MPPPRPLPGAATIIPAIRRPRASDLTSTNFDELIIPTVFLIVTVANSRFRTLKYAVAAAVPPARLAVLYAGAIGNTSAAILAQTGFANAVIVAG